MCTFSQTFLWAMVSLNLNISPSVSHFSIKVAEKEECKCFDCSDPFCKSFQMRNMQYLLLFKKQNTLISSDYFRRLVDCIFTPLSPSEPGGPDSEDKHFGSHIKSSKHSCSDVYRLYLPVILMQMLQRSRVEWRGTRGRETRSTSAARWRLTPELRSFGSEMVSRFPLRTPPTWRSTTHRLSATWRSAARRRQNKTPSFSRPEGDCFFLQLTEISNFVSFVSFQILIDFSVCSSCIYLSDEEQLLEAIGNHFVPLPGDMTCWLLNKALQKGYFFWCILSF